MYSRPQIVVSKCLGFSKCRYDGQTIREDFVELLKKYCDFITVCPEVSIGLGTPRDSIRILRNENKTFMLYQPTTQINLTDNMNQFSETFLSNLNNVDGFFLKASSPSCGVKGVAIYVGDKKIPEKRDGFFAEKIKQMFPSIPIEDEGRLKNYHIREEFLTKIFTLAKFNSLKEEAKSLVQFQAENKYLFMNLNQKITTELGRIIANSEKLSITDVFIRYRTKLLELMEEKIKKKRTVNSLQHILGYFSKELIKEEKQHFLELLEQFRNGEEYLFTLNQLLWSWILRYNKPYLKQQTFFNPYPKELMEGVNYSSRVSR